MDGYRGILDSIRFQH